MSGGGRIGDLVAKLERLGADQLKERVAVKVRDAVHRECILGFVEQRNPYGTPWAPRKLPTGTWNLLDKTGAGIESLTAEAIGERVVLRMRGYFRYLQSGTVRMVPRLVFPETMYGLGTWSEPVKQASLEAVREAMKDG